MNYLTAEKLTDLQHLMYLEIELIDKLTLSSREIWLNTWCIEFTPDFLQKLIFNDLKKFIHDLVEARRKQVARLNHKPGAVFYVWYDQQNIELCCNILSGKNRALPFFANNVVIVDSPDFILRSYLNDAKKNAIKLQQEKIYQDDVEEKNFIDNADSDQGAELEQIVYVYREQFDYINKRKTWAD